MKPKSIEFFRNTRPPDVVLKIVRNHQFALELIAGEWQMIESSNLKAGKEGLRRLNDNLQDRTVQSGRFDTATVIPNERLHMETSESEQLQRVLGSRR